MSVRTDYIPRKDADLAPWSANFYAQVSAKAQAWGITPEEVNALQAADAAFAALQKQTGSPAKNAIIVAQKNDARKNLESIIRTLAGFRLRNPIITDAERIAAGLHVRDTKPTSVNVPKTCPGVDIKVLDFRRLKVFFRNLETKGKGKPYGAIGAVIIYTVLDAPPSGLGALTRNVLATRTPHILEFTEEERGKTVYIAVCWQNGKGEMGPFSDIEKAIIP